MRKLYFAENIITLW